MFSSTNSAAPICQELPIKQQITNDLKKKYKNILEKHLEGRIITENNINSWMNNILIDAKNYFTSKYPDYDLFLYVFVCPRNVYFYSNSISISSSKTDLDDSTTFITNDLYSLINYFFYKRLELTYELEESENEIKILITSFVIIY